MAYLLTTKLFCGHCKEEMTGYAGTSKTGTMYHYYKCKGARKKLCHQKTISKPVLEESVIQTCLRLFTDYRVRFVADEMSRLCLQEADMLSIKRIQAAIDEINHAIDNLWRALEQGQSVQKITDRIHMREAEKRELQKQLAIEQQKNAVYDYLHILAYLDYVLSSNCEDTEKRKDLITMFVDSIYLFDNHYSISFAVVNVCIKFQGLLILLLLKY